MVMATMDMPVMPTPTVTMDTTARGLLMLRLPPLLMLMPMLTSVPMDMALLTTAMDTALPTTVMPTMDTDMPTVMPIPMPTMDTTARGLLMLPPLLMLTMVLMAMVSPTTDGYGHGYAHHGYAHHGYYGYPYAAGYYGHLIY